MNAGREARDPGLGIIGVGVAIKQLDSEIPKETEVVGRVAAVSLHAAKMQIRNKLHVYESESSFQAPYRRLLLCDFRSNTGFCDTNSKFVKLKVLSKTLKYQSS